MSALSPPLKPPPSAANRPGANYPAASAFHVDFHKARTTIWRRKELTMFGTRTGNPKVTDQEPASYATGADFCRIFKRDMNSLYLLSFLLTGDHAIAEKCFVRGLEVSSKSHPVFKKWAES